MANWHTREKNGDEPPEEFSWLAANWRPERVETSELITPGPARALAGLFDDTSTALEQGDPLPPMWHMLYTLDRPAQLELDDDGHPRDGMFVPPLRERRRMFGGARVDFHGALRIGDTVTRRSEVVEVRIRRGSSGWLLITTISHSYLVDGEVKSLEHQDIVYRSRTAAQPAAPRGATDGVLRAPTTSPAEDDGSVWRLTLSPDTRMLFRFSALTYNAHRIHYDHDFTTRVEGYPNLIVHGPLLALTLLELPRRFAPQSRIASFEYRLRGTIFLPDQVCARGVPASGGVDLEAVASGNTPACTGSLAFESGPHRYASDSD